MLLATDPVVALVEIAAGFALPTPEGIGLFTTVDGPKVGNLDSIAIVAGFSDVNPAMIGFDLVIPEAGVVLTFAGGFIETDVGFVITDVGFVITGIGFVMTGIRFMMTGVGFIAGAMAGIPDPMDSRFLVSSDSTEIDTFRPVRRAIILHSSCF